MTASPPPAGDGAAPAQLQRGLKNRHIQLIALGGAIGTGLFYGSGESIRLAGPSILLGYVVVGVAMFFIMRALGEMAVDQPVAGSFSYYAYRDLGPFAGFFSGWNYWANYVAVSMAELVVVGTYVQFWFPQIPTWVTSAVFLASSVLVLAFLALVVVLMALNPDYRVAVIVGPAWIAVLGVAYLIKRSRQR